MYAMATKPRLKANAFGCFDNHHRSAERNEAAMNGRRRMIWKEASLFS